ncbi:MAG: hypothetical protein ABI345_02460 [Jatrophihabitans sp.]
MVAWNRHEAQSECARGVRLAGVVGAGVLAVAATVDLGEPTIIGLGTLEISATSATLGVESICGPLCGSGDRRLFAVRGGLWVQVSSQPTWIS